MCTKPWLACYLSSALDGVPFSLHPNYDSQANEMVRSFYFVLQTFIFLSVLLSNCIVSVQSLQLNSQLNNIQIKSHMDIENEVGLNLCLGFKRVTSSCMLILLFILFYFFQYNYTFTVEKSASKRIRPSASTESASSAQWPDDSTTCTGFLKVKECKWRIIVSRFKLWS